MQWTQIPQTHTHTLSHTLAQSIPVKFIKYRQTCTLKHTYSVCIAIATASRVDIIEVIHRERSAAITTTKTSLNENGEWRMELVCFFN